jgi:hypothetical protein
MSIATSRFGVLKPYSMTSPNGAADNSEGRKPWHAYYLPPRRG